MNTDSYNIVIKRDREIMFGPCKYEWFVYRPDGSRVDWGYAGWKATARFGAKRLVRRDMNSRERYKIVQDFQYP